MVNVTKKILMAPEIVVSPVGHFFQRIGFECLSDLMNHELSQISFILNDFYPEVSGVRRIKTTTNSFPISLENEVVGYIQPEFLDQIVYSNLLNFCIDQDQTTSAFDFLLDNSNQVVELKIQDQLNVGYFVDTVAIFAFQNQFDYSLIRSYLNELLLENLGREENYQDLAIQLSFTCSQDYFGVQVNCKMTKKLEDLLAKKRTFRLMELTNCYSQFYFSKRNEVTISSIWFKDKNIRSAKMMHLNESFSKQKSLIDYNNKKNGLNLTGFSFLANTESKIDVHRDLGFAETLLLNLSEDNQIKEYLEDYFSNIKSNNLNPYIDSIIKNIESCQIFENPEWRMKREEIINNLKRDLQKIKNSGGRVVESDISNVIAQAIDIDKVELDSVLKVILQAVVSDYYINNRSLKAAFLNGNTDAINNVDEPFDQKADFVKAKKQVSILKEAVEKLRKEIIKLNENQSASSDQKTIFKLSELKNLLQTKSNELENKEKMILKMRNDFNLNIKARDDKIKSLQDQLLSTEEELSEESLDTFQERVDLLQMEKENLQSKLEHVERKLEATQFLIEKLKVDKEKMEKKLNSRPMPIQIPPAKVSNSSIEKFDEKENDALIAGLKNDKAMLEEKLKLAIMEMKKSDQKLKLAIAQMQETQRKKSEPAASASKMIDSYTKQLETTTSRLNLAVTEIAEKKKESIKLKYENSQMASKVAELEKKLTLLLKKAS